MYRRTYDSREFKALLKNNGYKSVRTTGDHEIFSNGVNTVPIAKDLNRMICFRLIKELNLVESKHNRRNSRQIKRKHDVEALKCCAK